MGRRECEVGPADHPPPRGQAGPGEAADPVDGGADVRLAGPVSAAEQGPGEERVVVGVIHQAGDDPVDASSTRALGCGPRVPFSQAGGCLTPLMGQTLRDPGTPPPPLRLVSWVRPGWLPAL